MNKGRIRDRIILGVLMLLCVAFSGFLAMMYEDIHLDDSNTSKFYATVNWVYKTNNIPETIVIETKEFKSDLMVAKSIYDEIGVRWMYSLQEGDRIALRVRNSSVPHLMAYESGSFCRIVELEDEEKTIFSLDDHNAISARTNKSSIEKCAICLGILILLTIWFVYRVIKNCKIPNSGAGRKKNNQ